MIIPRAPKHRQTGVEYINLESGEKEIIRPRIEFGAKRRILKSVARQTDYCINSYDLTYGSYLGSKRKQWKPSRPSLMQTLTHLRILYKQKWRSEISVLNWGVLPGLSEQRGGETPMLIHPPRKKQRLRPLVGDPHYLIRDMYLPYYDLECSTPRTYSATYVTLARLRVIAKIIARRGFKIGRTTLYDASSPFNRVSFERIRLLDG